MFLFAYTGVGLNGHTIKNVQSIKRTAMNSPKDQRAEHPFKRPLGHAYNFTNLASA